MPAKEEELYPGGPIIYGGLDYSGKPVTHLFFKVELSTACQGERDFNGNIVPHIENGDMSCHGELPFCREANGVCSQCASPLNPKNKRRKPQPFEYLDAENVPRAGP